MATDPNSFEAGAPMDSMGLQNPGTEPMNAGSMNPAPTVPSAPTRKLVDIYTAMLFVAAIFLIVGSIALAMEKQRYGELFGNSWKIPPDYKISAVTEPGQFDSAKSFLA